MRSVPDQIKPRGRKCARCQHEDKRAKARARYAASPSERARALERARRWAAQNPERRREIERAWYRRMVNDPARHERELGDRRIRERLNGSVAAKVAPRSDTYGGWRSAGRGNHFGQQLDAAPLVAWLKYEFPLMNVSELAAYLGEDDRHLGRLLDGTQGVVSLHIADRICVSANCPHMLAVLYPMQEAA